MQEDDDERRHNANITALVVVAVLVILGVLVMQYLSASLKTERCIEERRRGCDSSQNP
ncbi:MAG: hypothetical protein WDM86_07540 [Rhizomicrobium sp.]